MFSGLVETTARVTRIEKEAGGVLVCLARPVEYDDIGIGDSISISGCCLTVVSYDENEMRFQAGLETLSKTTLGVLQRDDHVNTERSLALGDRLGGHLVTGHIDGTGELVNRVDEDEWSNMVFEAPPNLMRQMADKGSVAVDGVSLTLVTVTDKTFSVALIPHTLSHTTLGTIASGDRVNLETDLLAKYVQRQLEYR